MPPSKEYLHRTDAPFENPKCAKHSSKHELLVASNSGVGRIQPSDVVKSDA